MVSVFDGQLTRTWLYEKDKRKHVINLYHDTITGVRSAMLDYQEIRGSVGNSSLLMDSKGHRLFFTLEDLPGYIEIKRKGWTGFAYNCIVNDQIVAEATQEVNSGHEVVFRPKIIETTFTQDEHSEHPIAWYVIKTTRITDNIHTTVHRRFREFADLNSQVKQNLKGHHLRGALPTLPEKPLKQLTDHRDPTFIQERSHKLELYLASLVAVPHVGDMVCVKAFLGIMEQVREFSVSFHVPTIGMSLLPCDRLGDNTPATVGLVQKPDLCRGVLPGDSISKINGVPVAGMSFNAVVVRIKQLPRPLIIHFIQVIQAANKTATTNAAGAVSGVAVSTSDPTQASVPAPMSTPSAAGMGGRKLSEADEARVSLDIMSPLPADVPTIPVPPAAISNRQPPAAGIAAAGVISTPPTTRAAPAFTDPDIARKVDLIHADPSNDAGAGTGTGTGTGGRAGRSVFGTAAHKAELWGDDPDPIINNTTTPMSSKNPVPNTAAAAKPTKQTPAAADSGGAGLFTSPAPTANNSSPAVAATTATTTSSTTATAAGADDAATATSAAAADETKESDTPDINPDNTTVLEEVRISDAASPTVDAKKPDAPAEENLTPAQPLGWD